MGKRHTPVGFKHSEEAKAKISLALTGKVRSPETQAKMSASRKGIQYSDETRARMSESHKRENLSPEIRAALSQRAMGNKFALGHKLSDEAKAKMAEKKRGKKQTAEHIAKCAASRIGRKLSQETKDKIAAAHKGRKLPEGIKVRLSEINSGENHPQWRGGISAEPYCQEWQFGDIKDYIKERDQGRCLNPRCDGTKDRVCVHHVNYIKKDCSRINLITLCIGCNSRANFNRKSWTALYQLILNQRYGYQYLIQQPKHRRVSQ